MQSGRKCFLCILFREIEITEKADEGSHNPAPVRAVNFFYGCNGVHSKIVKFFSGRVSIAAAAVRYINGGYQ